MSRSSEKKGKRAELGRLEEVSLSELVLIETPKKHTEYQKERLRRSIKTVGFVAPIVVDAENKVVNGRLRVEVARELGMEKVPAYRLDRAMTEEEIKAFSVADAETYFKGSWDIEKLKETLAKIDIEKAADFGHSAVQLSGLKVVDRKEKEGRVAGYILLEFTDEEFEREYEKIKKVLDEEGIEWRLA